MDEHQVPMDELITRVGANIETGLSSNQAAERLERDGYNMLTPPATTPEWVKFMKEMTGFFSLLLWLGSVLCFVGFALQKQVDNLYLGIVLAVVVFATGCFSYFQNRKSEDLMASFKNMMPTSISVRRDGNVRKLDAKELVVGDIIILKGGDKVPADARVIDCSDDMQVDNSSLTGESEPLKRLSECTDANPLETKNMCFFGTLIPQGSSTCIIVNTGDRTVMGRIARLATSTEVEQTPINKEIEHFVHIVSGVAIILGLLFFIIGVSIGTDMLTNLVFMIGIIVANVPEGLLATVTVCLTLTANRMAKKQVLVKLLEGVETLGSTSCICSDKTGTLTQNIMTVANIVYDNKIWDCESSLTPVPTYSLDSASFKALQRCATLCNTASFDHNSTVDKQGNPMPFKEIKIMGDGSQMEVVAWQPIGDASESAMIKFVQDKGDIEEARAANKVVKKIPFNSANKYQVHIHEMENRADNRLICMKGAPERIIARCSEVLIDGNVVEFTPELRAEVEARQLELSKKGMRVLGFCEKFLPTEQYPPEYEFNIDNANFPLGNKDVDYSTVPTPDKRAEEGLCFLGLMALIDPPRPQVPGAVAKCKTAGIKVIMVTGDHPVTAKAIAHKVGILWGPTKEDIEEANAAAGLERGDIGWEDPEEAPAIVIPGWTISQDTPVHEWDRILDHNQIVFARTSPTQKLIIVENNQRRKEVVAVTGDGVNDSPALKKADIGVAMGIMGSEVSKEAADMILLDDNFASIVAGVEEGRLIFDNLKKSIAYTLSSNIPEISPFLCFIVLQTPLPLSTVLILAVDLGTDMVPAISMAYEKPESDIMKRPPRNAEVDRLVTKKLVSFAYLQIGVIQAAAGFFTWMVVLNDYGYPPKILTGLGVADSWGKIPLHCRFLGGKYVDRDGNEDLISPRDPTSQAPMYPYVFWDEGEDGVIDDCQFPIKNFRGSKAWNGFDFRVESTYGRYTKKMETYTYESVKALEAKLFFEYVPIKARFSPFWNDEWLMWDINDDKVEGYGDAVDDVYFQFQGVGVYKLAASTECAIVDGVSGCRGTDEVIANGDQLEYVEDFEWCTDSLGNCTSLSDKVYSYAEYTTTSEVNHMYDRGDYCNGDDDDLSAINSLSSTGYTECCRSTHGCVNVASRETQGEALHHAQGAFFVSIVVVQWADLLICKTRWLSIRQQGMSNSTMNFGLFFETLLCGWLCYCPEINLGLGTRPLRLTHWVPGMPFSMCILLYDECRKYLMRTTSIQTVDKQTGRIVREPGWLERNTYY